MKKLKDLYLLYIQEFCDREENDPRSKKFEEALEKNFKEAIQIPYTREDVDMSVVYLKSLIENHVLFK